MTEPRRKPVSYDAFEDQEHVMFILDGPSVEGGIVAHRVLDGHGVEMTTGCGTELRFANVHPRLMEASRSKILMVALLSDTSVCMVWTTTADLDPKEAIVPPTSFYWYFDPLPTTLADLGGRPGPRLLAALDALPVAVSPGAHHVGSCIGLCTRPGPFIGLTPGRRWSSARPGFLVETTIVSRSSEGHPAGDDIAASVGAAFDPSSPMPPERPRAAWRSQVAIVIGSR